MFILATVFLKALREKDGIPDLRRAARFRYSSVALPEVSFSNHCYKSSMKAINLFTVLMALVLDSCLRLRVMLNGY